MDVAMKYRVALSFHSAAKNLDVAREFEVRELHFFLQDPCLISWRKTEY